METLKPNPVMTIEHLGAKLRVTLNHEFSADESITLTVSIPSGDRTLGTLNKKVLDRAHDLLSLLDRAPQRIEAPHH